MQHTKRNMHRRSIPVHEEHFGQADQLLEYFAGTPSTHPGLRQPSPPVHRLRLPPVGSALHRRTLATSAPGLGSPPPSAPRLGSPLSPLPRLRRDLAHLATSESAPGPGRPHLRRDGALPTCRRQNRAPDGTRCDPSCVLAVSSTAAPHSLGATGCGPGVSCATYRRNWRR